jgi:hypothetical protein
MSKFKVGDKVRNVDDRVWVGGVETALAGVLTVASVEPSTNGRGEYVLRFAELLEASPLHRRYASHYAKVKPATYNQFELKGYTEGGMYVDYRFVSGPDEAKEYIEGAHCHETAVHYKLFEHVPAGEFKVSSVTTRTVAQL